MKITLKYLLIFNQELILAYQEEKVNFIFQVNFELYQKIDKDSLFNLKEAARKTLNRRRISA